jgi:hypothetical protein
LAALDDRHDVVPGDQACGRRSGARRVTPVVLRAKGERLAQDSAGRVDLRGGERRAASLGAPGGGAGARKRAGESDQDLVMGRRRAAARKARGRPGRQEEPVEAETSISDAQPSRRAVPPATGRERRRAGEAL